MADTEHLREALRLQAAGEELLALLPMDGTVQTDDADLAIAHWRLQAEAAKAFFAGASVRLNLAMFGPILEQEAQEAHPLLVLSCRSQRVPDSPHPAHAWLTSGNRFGQWYWCEGDA